jgi:hypothetical protein
MIWHHVVSQTKDLKLDGIRASLASAIYYLACQDRITIMGASHFGYDKYWVAVAYYFILGCDIFHLLASQGMLSMTVFQRRKFMPEYFKRLIFSAVVHS